MTSTNKKLFFTFSLFLVVLQSCGGNETKPASSVMPTEKSSREKKTAQTSSSKTLLNMPAENASLSPQEIVKRSDDLLRGESNKGVYTMKIKTPQWERELKLNVFSVGQEKIFIRILAPQKEAGIGSLRIGSEMWNYLPRIEKMIKIPPSTMLQPWMGSDFANDDLVKESSLVNDYTHKIVQEEVVDGQQANKIELTPKPDAAVVWGKIYMWIRKADFVPLKIDYYNEKNELIKSLHYSDIGVVSDRTIPRTWEMIPVKKPGNSTVIKLIDVQYNTTIDENIFTLNNLKRIQ